MKHSFLILTLLAFFVFVGCQESDSRFLIAETSVGPLTTTTAAKDLETLFSNDSIVRNGPRVSLGTSSQKIQVYEKGGNLLLTLTPTKDSTATIEHIRIHDKRYSTQKGIGLESSFAAIKGAYDIKKIVTTMNSIVVFPKGSTLYFTIDKAELPANLRFTTSTIEAVQIPDEAKIKYLMLSWN